MKNKDNIFIKISTIFVLFFVGYRNVSIFIQDFSAHFGICFFLIPANKILIIMIH